METKKPYILVIDLTDEEYNEIKDKALGLITRPNLTKMCYPNIWFFENYQKRLLEFCELYRKELSTLRTRSVESKKLRVLANAILDEQKHGQLHPDTIKALEQIAGRGEK